MRVRMPFAFTPGDVLELEAGGNRLWGHVVHCQADERGFTLGLEMERVLLGGPDTSQVLRRLLEDTVIEPS